MRAPFPTKTLLAMTILASAYAPCALAQVVGETGPNIKLFSSSKDVLALIDKVKAERKEGQPLIAAPILTLAPYRASLEYRAAKAPAALHETEAEVMYVIEGTGTIVTGTVLSGAVTAGDRVVVSPSRRPARVRSVHAQNQPAARGVTGERCWSALSENVPPNTVRIVRDGEGPWSSGPTTRRVDPSAIGASLTGVTVWVSTTPPVLMAVLPPLCAPDTSTPAIACAPPASRSDPNTPPDTPPVNGTSCELSISCTALSENPKSIIRRTATGTISVVSAATTSAINAASARPR